MIWKGPSSTWCVIVQRGQIKLGTLIKQELYKLTHRRGTWFGLFFILIIQMGMATLVKLNPSFIPAKEMVMSSFLGTSMTLFVVIAAVASIVSMEFQYGTVKQLLYRKYYRSQVFVSKIIVVILHTLALYLVQFAMTLLLKLALFPKVDLGATYSGGHSLLRMMVTYQGGEILSAFLLLSFVLLLSTLFKTNAAAIASGYIGYVLVSMASTFLLLAIQKWEWVKWNPFTMLLLPSQLMAPNYADATMLSNPELIAGSLVYTVIFSGIAYLSFRKRSV